jgi:hypothetical protein
MKHVYFRLGCSPLDDGSRKIFFSSGGEGLPVVTIRPEEQICRGDAQVFFQEFDPDCLTSDEEFIILHKVLNNPMKYTKGKFRRVHVFDAITHKMTREVCIKILAKVNGVAPEDIDLREFKDWPLPLLTPGVYHGVFPDGTAFQFVI